MLQIRYRFMSLSALALAALTLPAAAVSTCDLADGLSLDPAVFNQEVSACYASQSDSKSNARLEGQLIDATDRIRADDSKAALTPLASLEQAARIHAMDMAARDYAGHADPEGRGHLERVRMLDRTVLIGAAGANIAAQQLETRGELGYVAADLEGDLPADFLDRIKAMDGTIRARLILG